MLRAAAASARAVLPVDGWDILGIIGLVMLGYGLYLTFGLGAALIAVGFVLAALAFLVSWSAARTPQVRPPGDS